MGGKKKKRGLGFCFKNLITNAGEEKEKVVIAARESEGSSQNVGQWAEQERFRERKTFGPQAN